MVGACQKSENRVWRMRISLGNTVHIRLIEWFAHDSYAGFMQP